jgi:hypothetical protein
MPVLVINFCSEFRSQAMLQIDGCWRAIKARQTLPAPDLRTIQHREQNCIDAPEVVQSITHSFAAVATCRV